MTDRLPSLTVPTMVVNSEHDLSNLWASHGGLADASIMFCRCGARLQHEDPVRSTTCCGIFLKMRVVKIPSYQ